MQRTLEKVGMCVSYEHVKLADSATAFRLPQSHEGSVLKVCDHNSRSPSVMPATKRFLSALAF